jgi:hypothetical protein
MKAKQMPGPNLRKTEMTKMAPMECLPRVGAVEHIIVLYI